MIDTCYIEKRREKSFAPLYMLLILFLFPQFLLAVDVKDFKIAIFWNSGTEIVPYETPVGYSVASPDTTSAPEIGKSALKLFLSSLDPTVGYNGSTTLDTVNIKERVADNSGVVEGASPAILPNARIFNVYDPLSLDDVRATFDGETPEVIAVINAGGQVDYAPLKQLLYEASLAEIGILLVGSASTSFAVAIDELAVQNGKEKFFAVKGIQKSFNVESYKGSLLFDFDLRGDMTQDSVVMMYDGGKHFIREISDVKYNASTDSYTYSMGDTIYMQGGVNDLNAGIDVKHHYGQFVISNAKAQSVIEYDSYDPAMNSGIFYNSAVLGINGSSELITTENISADTIPSVSATNNIIAANSVIQEAGTAVAFGDNVPRAWIRAKTGSDYGNSVSYKAEQSVPIPGTEAYGDGTAYIHTSSTSTEFHMYAPSKNGADGSDATDYTAFYTSGGVKYPEVSGGSGLYKVTTNDTVFVYSYTAGWAKDQLLGSFIVDSVKNAPEGYRFTFTDDFKINNSVIFKKSDVFDFVTGYEMRYPAKGYDSLSIDIKNISSSGNSEIFAKIFGSGESNLSGSDSTILFKDWKPNGRIQSAAEIWAVDTAGGKVAKFSDWYGAGGSFDENKIYFGRFGQQVARGEDQFFYLEENGSNSGFDKTKFNMLPDGSNARFADKEYYALSVIQRKHQRLAIVGYEPQFLADTELSKNILRDIFAWTAIDDSRMPVGKIEITGPGTIYNANDTITNSVTQLMIILDYSQKDAAIYAAGATIQGALMNQAGNAITLDWANPTIKKDGAKQIDTLVYDITGKVSSPTSVDSLYITDMEIVGDAPFSSTVDSTLFIVAGNVTVDKQLSDVTLIEDAADTTVADLDTVFTTMDASTLTYSVESTDSSKVVGKLSGENLILDAQENATGIADIIVKADDSKGNVSFDTLTVTLTAVNDAPIVASAITDVTVTEDAPDTNHVDLNSVFTDVDGDDLTFSVTSSSGNSIVTPTVGAADSVLTLSFTKDANGLDTIIVIASDGVLSVADTVVVTVTAEDDSPIVSTGISDVVVDEGAADTAHVDLNSVFTDPDGDALTFSVLSKSGNALVTPTIGAADSVLTLSFTADANGLDTIIVTASDGILSVSDTFLVTINALNDDPNVVAAIVDVVVDEDAPDTAHVDLNSVFNDVDGDGLTFAVTSSSGNAIVTPTIGAADSVLTLSFTIDANGLDTIVVTAFDGIATVADTFLVTVNPVQDAPYIVVPITDITTPKDGSDTTFVDLDSIFADVDGDVLSFTTVSGNSAMVIGTVGPDGMLTLDVQDGQYGNTTMIVTADDGKGNSVSDTFAITIPDYINDDPVVTDSIADVFVNEDAADLAVADLDTIFTDPDGDALTYTVISNNEALVTASIDAEGKLILDFQDNANGVTQVIVTASDGSLSTNDTIVVTVAPIDDAPIVSNPIADVVALEDSNDSLIADLNTVFTDIDGDALTFSAFSQDESLVTVAVDVNGNCILDFQDNQSGLTSVIVTGTDGITPVSDTFSVTITAENDDPIVNDTIADVIVDEDSEDSTIVDLDSIFTDIDGDTLTYSCISLDSTIVIGLVDVEGLLTLDFQKDGFGTTMVIVTATDGTTEVHDTVMVTVNGINDGPHVEDPIDDVIIDEDSEDSTIVDLDSVFIDVDGDELTYSCISLDSSLVIGIVDLEGFLTLNLQENQYGQTIVIVTADDGVLQAHDTVVVTVNEVNDDPDQTDTIPDVIIDEDSEDTTIVDLDSIFIDVDEDSLIYSCVSKDSTIVIGIVDTEGFLILDLQENGFGTTLVIVTADDGTFQVHDTVVVTVNGLEDDPYIVDSIPDIITPDDGSDTTVADLDDVFDDPDGDTLTYTAISLDSVLVIPYVDTEGLLTLDVQDNQTGETIVIVTADDGKGNTVSDTFLVIVDLAVTDDDDVVDFFWGHIMIPGMFETLIRPNPAPPSAQKMQFIFKADKADEVELHLFDALGEKVAETEVAVSRKGIAFFEWDLRNLRNSYRANSYLAYVIYKKEGNVISTERHMIGLKR